MERKARAGINCLPDVAVVCMKVYCMAYFLGEEGGGAQGGHLPRWSSLLCHLVTTYIQDQDLAALISGPAEAAEDGSMCRGSRSAGRLFLRISRARPLGRNR